MLLEGIRDEDRRGDAGHLWVGRASCLGVVLQRQLVARDQSLQDTLR